MKYTTSVYLIGILALIAGTVLKVLQKPFGNTLLWLGVAGVVLFQVWHIAALEKKIRTSENNSPDFRILTPDFLIRSKAAVRFFLPS